MACFCGKSKAFFECCQPYILGVSLPSTAEELMRSRYSAFSTGSLAYLIQTTHPECRDAGLANSIMGWISQVSSWDRLEILSARKGGPKDDRGWVEFRVYFHQNGVPQIMKENSEFSRVEGRWVYLQY